MAAVGDKYVITMKGVNTLLDPAGANPFYNVFAYEATGGTPSAADLRLAFDTVLQVPIGNILSAATELVLYETTNLDDPVDFEIYPFSAVGQISGDYLPPFAGWEFQYVRAVRGVHHGRKTFSIVAETSQVNGAPTSGQLTLLTTLEALLGSVLSGPNGNYTPRIWRRAGTYKVGGVPTVFPDTFYPIAGVIFNRLSTQNSRKR